MVGQLKAAAWEVVAGSYYYAGLSRLRHRGRVVILTYHRVVSDDMVREEHMQPGMYVRAESFEAHIDYLRKQFAVLALEELLEIWRAGRLDRRKSYCVITFDDGWRDNYEYAFPILKKHELPATIFLATDYIGTSRWFWPDKIAFVLGQAGSRRAGHHIRTALESILQEVSEISAAERERYRLQVGSSDAIDSDRLIEWCKSLKPELIDQIVNRLSGALSVNLPDKRVLLNWNEVHEMASQGVTFGSHSCSHRLMTQLSPSEARQELTGSWQAMLQHGIKPVPVFCYPNGDCNQTLNTLAKENGYVAALGCEIGLEESRPKDLFALKRIGLHEDTTSSIPLLVFALSGLR